MSQRALPLLATTAAALALLLGGCGSHAAKATGKQTRTPKAAAKAAATSGTPVSVGGYTAYLPQDVLDNTPGLAVARTPYGLVWSSYGSSVDTAGGFQMPHAYAVEISPWPGSGALEGSGRLIAELPSAFAGQAVDLHFVGATGPYLGFVLDTAGTAMPIDAGMLDLTTGKVEMVPQSLVTDAGVVVGGGRMGIMGPNATYVFQPATGAITTYPMEDANTLWADLAYGLPVGSADVPDPVRAGVAAYDLGGGAIYAPPAWSVSSRQLGGDFTLWRVTDPQDPAAFVQVEAAPCTGCSVVSLTSGALAAPQVILPDATGAATVSERWLTDYVIAYQGTAPGYHYPVWGLAIAPRPGQSGFEEVVVSLPPQDGRLAAAIIASYPLPR